MRRLKKDAKYILIKEDINQVELSITLKQYTK